MGVFEGLIIALDLGYSLNVSKKAELKNKVVQNGGTVSYVVTRKCHFVVTTDPEKCDVSSKCRMAIKHGLPVLKLDYIWDSLQMQILLPFDLYVVGGKSKTLDFKSGKISAQHNESLKKFSYKTAFNPRIVKICTATDSILPWCYEETHEVAKYAIFSGYSASLKCQSMAIIELHTPPAVSSVMNQSKMAVDTNQQGTQFNYRVILQTGSIKDLEAGKQCHTEVRYVSTADQALAVFAMLYEDTEKKSDMKKWTGPVRAIGSLKFQKLMAGMVDVHSSCSDEIKELVEHIWSEAMTEVTSILGDISGLKIEQVEKAEAILVKVRDAIKSSRPENIIQYLISEFYSTLHHKNESSDTVVGDKRRWLVKKQDMCQLIRDVISVSEMTYYETRAYVEAKYAALRCRITNLRGHQREEIEQQITSSLEGTDQDLTVLNVYEVWRQVEDLDFRHDLDGKQLLFHSSKVENFVGILSRGLLLPKVVVDDFGGKRSDAGMLGSGIYFASSASTSVKYSSPSKIKGSRLLLVNEVALGHCKDYTTHDTTLVAPPDGYNSTHGVSRKLEKTSKFENDEFVVYSVNQQRVRYLVEFTIKGDTVKPVQDIYTNDTNILCDAVEATSLADVTGITDPLSKVKPGLVGTGNREVELRGVHIRAKLIDLAAQVVVLQEYCNNSPYAIEAKYIFPLEDTAAVCGFEAFINGKHIVGEVKEKETAHKEYKKAISEGHGAYLMDQDEETPDIFTVSVGNLPPGASVLIKITYVAELQVEEEQISFLLPATVAPWKEDSALKQSTQDELESYKMTVSKTTIQIAVEMPFDIRNLHCPTHQIRVKQTASKAFVEMTSHQKFGSGFQLLIGLAEIHVPRMWVESHPVNKDHQACMLTFYPEFESAEVVDGEIIIILDTSNSMKGTSLSEAKKVALLVLQNLPSSWNFNLVRFGSDCEELFPAPRTNTEGNLQIAISFIQNSVASKGNTDVMQPLRSLFLLPRVDAQRNVFLISDGHINDDELVLRCANQNSTHTRVFSFGVSATCNSYLLKALSRVSGGAFEFFNTKTKSKWEPKIKSQLSKARQPGLTSVSVEWQQYDENLPPPVQAPQQITALFNGSRQVVYGFVPNCTMATLKANVEGQDVSTVVSTSELSITEGMLVHRLTARAVIRDWEDGVLSKDRTKHEMAKMDLKNYIIDLSKEYSIVTQFTSFIAVEKREENEKDWREKGPSIEELVENENVDILNYMGWTRVPEDDSITIMSMINELSKAVAQQEISNKVVCEMETIEKKYKTLRDHSEPCSEDILNAANVLTAAYYQIGDTDKAADIAEVAYKEAVKQASRLVVNSNYPQLAEALLNIREKATSMNRDISIKNNPIPLPKTGRVFVKCLTGSVLTIPCDGSITIGQLRELIHATEGKPSSGLRLIYNGKLLDDDNSNLADENIGHGDNINIVMRLRCGFKSEVSDLIEEMGVQDAIQNKSFDAVVRKQIPRKAQNSVKFGSVKSSGFTLDGDDSPASRKAHKSHPSASRRYIIGDDSYESYSARTRADRSCYPAPTKPIIEDDSHEYDSARVVPRMLSSAPIRSLIDSASIMRVAMGSQHDLYMNNDMEWDLSKNRLNASDDNVPSSSELRMACSVDVAEDDEEDDEQDDEQDEQDDDEEDYDDDDVSDDDMGFGLFDGEANAPIGFGGSSEVVMSQSHSGYNDVAGQMGISNEMSGFGGSREVVLKQCRREYNDLACQMEISNAISADFGGDDDLLEYEDELNNLLTGRQPQWLNDLKADTQPQRLNDLMADTQSEEFNKNSACKRKKEESKILISSPQSSSTEEERLERKDAAPGPSFKIQNVQAEEVAPAASVHLDGTQHIIPSVNYVQSMARARRHRKRLQLDQQTRLPLKDHILKSKSVSQSKEPVLEHYMEMAKSTPSRKNNIQPLNRQIRAAPPPPPPPRSLPSTPLSMPSLPSRRPTMSYNVPQYPAGSSAVSFAVLEQRQTEPYFLAKGEALSLSSAESLAAPVEMIAEDSITFEADKLHSDSRFHAAFGGTRDANLVTLAKECKEWEPLSNDFSRLAKYVKHDKTRSSLYSKKMSDAARLSDVFSGVSCKYLGNLESPVMSEVKKDEYSTRLTSSGVECIRTKGKNLMLQDLEKLLQCQNEEGFWELKSNLDELIWINSKECLRFLMSNGLSSLGKNATDDIQHLVATFLVIFSILELIMPELFPVDASTIGRLALSGIDMKDVSFENLKEHGLTDEMIQMLMTHLEKACKFCINIERRYPVVYSTLELGTSWVHVAVSLMQPHVA